MFGIIDTISSLFCFCYLCFVTVGEYCEVIVDYGGRVEDLVLMSHKQGKLRKTLLTHNENVTAIKENAWWMGMILFPWANRIAKVGFNAVMMLVLVSGHIIIST